MRHRRIPRLAVPLLGLLILLLAGPVGVADAETVVLAPSEFTRRTGQPNVATVTFPACRLERAFRLRIENGPRGGTRLSSGSAVLNGTEVISQSQLSQQVSLIERSVQLNAQNTLTLTLAGTPLGTIAVSVVSDSGCGPIITAPQPGAVVPAGPLLVEGSTETTGEAGIIINGAPAIVEGTRFVGLVPVHPEDTELVVVATTPAGERTETRQPLTVTDLPEPEVLLHIGPTGGPAPLEVTFSLTSRVPIALVALDLTGQGAIAYEGAALDEVIYAYPSPGIYVPTVTVTDPQGVVHQARRLLHVLDRAALDSRLQARWQALKSALRQGDVTQALDSMALDARETYRDLLTALTIPLSQIDQVLTDAALVDLDENRAEYQMVRMDNGAAMSYLVLFVRDVDGVWRLKFF